MKIHWDLPTEWHTHSIYRGVWVLSIDDTAPRWLSLGHPCMRRVACWTRGWTPVTSAMEWGVTREEGRHLWRVVRSLGGLDVCFLEINVLSLSLALLSLHLLAFHTSQPASQQKRKKGCVTIATGALDTSEQGFKIANTHYTAIT